jgi:predicted metalloprotease
MRRLVLGIKLVTYMLTVTSSLIVGLSATPSQAASQKSTHAHSSATAAKNNLQSDINDAVDVVDAFWKEHWSDYFTGHYTKPKGYGTYSRHGKPAPKCDGDKLSYNNAYYCSKGKFVAWGLDFMADGYKDGNARAYDVVAHEWGHAIQDQLDVSLHQKAYELQAECLAGAAIQGAADDVAIKFGKGYTAELKKIFRAVGDKEPWAKPGDHGTAAEQFAAFNKGAKGGVAKCLPEQTKDDDNDNDSGDDDDDSDDEWRGRWSTCSATASASPRPANRPQRRIRPQGFQAVASRDVVHRGSPDPCRRTSLKSDDRQGSLSSCVAVPAAWASVRSRSPPATRAQVLRAVVSVAALCGGGGERVAEVDHAEAEDLVAAGEAQVDGRAGEPVSRALSRQRRETRADRGGDSGGERRGHRRAVQREELHRH